MADELTAIKLLKTGIDLPSKPHIVIDVMLDKLLDVFIGGAVRIRCDPVDRGLQIGD